MCYDFLRAAYQWFVRKLAQICRFFGSTSRTAECTTCLLPMTNEDKTLKTCWNCRRRDKVESHEWKYLHESKSCRTSRSFGKRKGFASAFSVRRLQRSTSLFTNKEHRFALLNVTGIKGKFPEVCELLAKNKDILVLTLTDCRFSANDKDYTIPSFQLIKLDGRSEKEDGGGGKLVYIHSSCTYDLIRLPCKPPGAIECNILSIRKDEMPRTTLCIMYVPSEDVRDSFCQFFGKVCKHVKSSCRRVIIMGNFNVDWLTDNVYKQRLVETVTEFDLVQLVDEPTREKALMDHIYVNWKDSSNAVTGVDAGASSSEHSLISVKFN